ncbi:hypothetical protein [Levilactobacillus tongjiangensis]|uniref:Uncharacterized protein n=1 Tax=Levilactobacillus tongjiangensis TaxID=2486023 RepID=A0ABW1ST53_9LACO|nr:hypothetical protein [Levilactobacillus tongjiangensis]
MNKFVTSIAVSAGLFGCLGWGTTTAQAKSKWTAGTPKALRGSWTQHRSHHSGHDTEVSTNAMILTKKWLFVMTDFGGHDYGGNHLVYRQSHGVYRLRAYDTLEKSWSYTKVSRDGKKLTLQKYGKRKSGQHFKHVTSKATHLKYDARASHALLK